MFKKLLRLFCKHEYTKFETGRSNRVGYDIHLINVDFYKCKNCNKSFTVETLDKIEKDFYIE